jgi:hypothetical protein
MSNNQLTTGSPGAEKPRENPDSVEALRQQVAWAVLRRASQQRNTRVAVLAETIIRQVASRVVEPPVARPRGHGPAAGSWADPWLGKASPARLERTMALVRIDRRPIADVRGWGPRRLSGRRGRRSRMDRNQEPQSSGLVLPLLDEHLTEFARHASATLGTASSCSIIMELDGHLRRSASSNHESAACDDSEIASGAGPCLDAMEFRQVVMIDDVRPEQRWAEWAATTRAAGFLSAGAFPGHTGSSASVAVNVYRQLFGPWSRDDLVRADVYAQQVARVLDLCVRVGDLDMQQRALRDALEAQHTIDQAIGAVMATNHCDAATALSILRSGATSRNVLLSDVAASILDSLASPQHPAGH